MATKPEHKQIKSLIKQAQAIAQQQLKKFFTLFQTLNLQPTYITTYRGFVQVLFQK